MLPVWAKVAMALAPRQMQHPSPATTSFKTAALSPQAPAVQQIYKPRDSCNERDALFARADLFGRNTDRRESGLSGTPLRAEGCETPLRPSAAQPVASRCSRRRHRRGSSSTTPWSCSCLRVNMRQRHRRRRAAMPGQSVLHRWVKQTPPPRFALIMGGCCFIAVPVRMTAV
jgi:hypothetical protein